MHPSLQFLDHRPWPLPDEKWKWRQSWLDLAFIHYRVSPASLREKLPASIQLQEYDGSAWVGIVPFRMSGVMRRPFPDLPAFSAFPELNLRTYVEVDGKPGVWFFSLDAASWPIVLGGRLVYHLPYFHARMRLKREDECFEFSSVRHGGEARFKGRYRPHGESFLASPNSFEHWATERYCLYSKSQSGRIHRVEVHHAPWPLRKADIEIEENDLLAAAGIAPLNDDPVFLSSPGVDVVSFSCEDVSP